MLSVIRLLPPEHQYTFLHLLYLSLRQWAFTALGHFYCRVEEEHYFLIDV